MEKTLTKRFGSIYGAAIAPPISAFEMDDARQDIIREFIGARPRDEWQCVKHHWFDCFMCVVDVFLPTIDVDELAMFEAERMRTIVDRFPARLIKIAAVPSEYGMLIAAEWLSRHLDLEGVPGFYREELRAPLPGAPAETELLGWFKSALSTQHSALSTAFVWRINFPAVLMNRAARTAFVVPYDNGTGQVLGLRIYRSVRDQRPTLLTSRGLPGGHAAVAAA